MEIPDVKGLNTLYQAISEALEIEKCSICLEKLENTVLLWPCTHWFCNKCILTLHKSAKGEKVTCPLCKCATSRRKVLPFQDKQTEYEDYLQTLIGALSLDLKFDVTSYNNSRQHEKSTFNMGLETKKEVIDLSPFKETRPKAPVRVIEVNKKPEVPQDKKRFSRRSGNFPHTNSIKTKINTPQHFKKPKESTALLPETPDSPKKIKVKEWLDSNKFSQVDQDAGMETVVADIHITEQDESLSFSETALLSVSQMNCESVKKPMKPAHSRQPLDKSPDIDTIQNEYNSKKLFSTEDNLRKKQRAVNLPAVDKFDEIFSENRKIQAVTTTYGSKNPFASMRKRGQRFAVQADLFKSIDGDKSEIAKSGSDESLEKSEETLEDFSSGSGEEWTLGKKQKKNVLGKSIALKKTRQMAKKNKNSVKDCFNTNPREKSMNRSDIDDLKTPKIRKNGKILNQELNSSEGNAAEDISRPKDYIVRDIIDDWNDTKDSNNLFVKNQATNNGGSAVEKPKCKTISETDSENKIPNFNRPKPPDSFENEVKKTPCKEVNIRSPGWSRLKSTKKDFHLSEKKKLNLKTFNRSKSNSSLTNLGISPLLDNSKDSIINLSDKQLEKCDMSNNTSVVGMINLSKNKCNVNNVVKGICKSKEMDVDVPYDKENHKTSQSSKNLNSSLISFASETPFRGFPSPEEKECPPKSVSNINDSKETSQNTYNPLGYLQNQIENTYEVLSNKSQIQMDCLSRVDQMEVDILPTENHFESFHCENNKQKHTIESINKSSICKPLEDSRLDSSNANEIYQEESNRSLIMTKKRDRDSGIHNESGISSPIRKRICRDAEVQTSPSRMALALRDMLKDICGVELEQVIKQYNKDDVLKESSIDDVTNTDKSCTGLSQDSDKENFCIRSNDPVISSRILNDSDIVFGTEENTGVAKINHFTSSSKMMVDDYIDPDAPTQRYKTPVMPKKPLQTSTKDFTVVSNPTSSELKRSDSLFEKSDIIFPDETPKVQTPWNCSGVNQLVGDTGRMKKSDSEKEILILSQSSKERTNRSRRQLEFVEENSNDMFDFENKTSGSLREQVVNNCISSDQIETSVKVDEVDDIFLQGNELLEMSQNPLQDCQLDSVPNENIVAGNEMSSDTPGIVGPSEEQLLYAGVNLFSCDKQNYKAQSTENVVDKPVEHSPKSISKINKITKQIRSCEKSMNDSMKVHSNVHQEKVLLRASSFEQKAISSSFENVREDDDESNPSSDISYVEGTPDASQCGENNKEILSIENEIKETNDLSVKPMVSCLENQSEVEIEKSEISFHDPNKNEVSQLRDREIIDDEPLSFQMMGNTEVESENLCFASSLLNLQQTHVLVCVLGGMGLTYSKTVGSHISHLVVGTKNGCFQNTYKVLLAMALHKPIIRFDWVEEVIRTGATVPLDPFIARDPSGECGVLRAKADTNRQLLHNFAIHIYNVNDRIVLKEQIEELVRLCGGTVVKELSDFHIIPRDKHRIIVLSEPPDSLTQGDWRQKYSAVEVMIDWIYNTIGRYRLMPLVPFMLSEAADAIPFLLHEGYPKELVFELSTQD